MRVRSALILGITGIAMFAFATGAKAAPTDLDTNFGVAGIVANSMQWSEQAIFSTAVQSDGKIVAVGSDNGSQEWLIQRFNSDGSLDQDFDGPSTATGYPGNGRFELNPSTSFDSAVDVKLTASGKIVVAGNVRNTVTGKTEFGAVRLLAADGDFDPTFNSGAIKTFEIDDGATGNDAYVSAVDVRAGKIVIGGYANDGAGNNTDFAVGRLENDGDLDTTLDGDGTGLKSMTANAVDYLSDVYIDASENIVMFGTSGNPADISERVLVASRFTSTGSPDLTFGGGTAKVYATGISGYGGQMTVRSSGEYVMVGSTNLAPYDCFAVQFVSGGAVDLNFSGDGYQTIDFKNGTDSCTAVDEDAAGNILIGGTTKDAAFSGDAALARLDSDGELDTTFDPDGRFIQKLSSGNDAFNTVVGLAGGEILLGGFEGSNGAGAQASVLEQLAGGNGGFTAPTRPSPLTLDNTFDADGLVRSDLSSGRIDDVKGMAVASDGSPVVVGSSEFLFQPSTSTYLPEGTVAKYLPNGSPDTSFDGDGVVKLDLPSYETAIFYDAAVLSDGSIMVVGKYTEAGAGSELMIAKFTSAGVLDTSFDGDGQLIHDFDGNPLEYGQVTPESIHMLSDGSFLVAGSKQLSGDWSMFAAKFDSAGQFVNSYGTNGLTGIDFDLFAEDFATDSVALPDGSIAIVGYATISGERSCAIAKLDMNGDPDTTFSGDGELLQDFGSGESQANAVALQGDGKLLIAGTGFDGALTEDAFAARIATDGSLDADVGQTLGFSVDGFAFVPFGSEADTGNGIAVDPVDGTVTLGGSVNFGLDDDFAFARFDATGNLLPGFDGDGFGSTEVGSGYDNMKELLIDSSRRVIAAGTVNDSGLSDFGLARLAGPIVPGAPPADGGQPPAVAPLIAGSSKISSPVHNKKYTAKKFKKIKGTATSVNLADPVTKVEIALRRVDSKRCYWLSSSKAKFRKSAMKNKKCSTLRWMKVTNKTSWYLKLRKTLPKDNYELYSRVTLASGTVESSFRTKTNKVRFKLR